MTIQPEIATLEQLIKESQETLQKAQQDLENYKKLVKQGVLTLGSDLNDFVFVYHTDNREYWHNFYSALANLCTEDTPIMFEYTGTTSRLKISRWAGPNEYASEPYTTHIIGILSNPPSYNIRNGQVVFPVEFYIANYHEIFSRDKLERKEGPLVVSVDSFKNYGKYIYHHYVQGDIGAMPDEHSMKIIFGNKEEYLRRKSQTDQDAQNTNYDTLFQQKRLVGPFDEKTQTLRLTSQ